MTLGLSPKNTINLFDLHRQNGSEKVEVVVELTEISTVVAILLGMFTYYEICIFGLI